MSDKSKQLQTLIRRMVQEEVRRIVPQMVKESMSQVISSMIMEIAVQPVKSTTRPLTEVSRTSNEELADYPTMTPRRPMAPSTPSRAELAKMMGLPDFAGTRIGSDDADALGASLSFDPTPALSTPALAARGIPPGLNLPAGKMIGEGDMAQPAPLTSIDEVPESLIRAMNTDYSHLAKKWGSK